MRILITGAAGMLGSELPPLLAPRHTVLAPSHAECDITDEVALQGYFAPQKLDVVINCAAMSDVDGCEGNPQSALALNARGPGYLARAAERAGARLIHISTDYVFDGGKQTAYAEQDATGPLSRYGSSKLEGEREVLKRPAGLSGPAPHLAIRTSWLYGRYRANFVDSTVERARAGSSIKAVAEQVSCPTWTYPLAQRITQLVETGARGLLHLAGAGECSRYEMARYIADRIGSRSEIAATSWEELKRPARRPVHTAMISTRLAELGLAPLPDWKESLDSYLRLRFGIG